MSGTAARHRRGRGIVPAAAEVPHFDSLVASCVQDETNFLFKADWTGVPNAGHDLIIQLWWLNGESWEVVATVNDVDWDPLTYTDTYNLLTEAETYKLRAYLDGGIEYYESNTFVAQ